MIFMAVERDNLSAAFFCNAEDKAIHVILKIGGYMKKVLLLIVLFIVSSLLFAGPFGMNFGDSIEEAEAKGTIILDTNRDASIVACNITPPNITSRLTIYLGYFEDTYGLYMMRAYSDFFTNESVIRNTYNALRQQLIVAYGNPYFEIDHIDSDSIWDEPNYFVESLYYGDRELSSYWLLAEPINGVSMLILHVDSVSPVFATVELEYSGENYDNAQESYTTSAAAIL